MGQITQEEHKAFARIVVEVPKAHRVLELARDIKSKRKGFYKYIGNIIKAVESVGLLLNGARKKAHERG